MIKRLAGLFRNERAASLVEFALIAPVFCTFLIAIGNFGILFFAQAGLKSAVAEGARFATLSPRPSNDAIVARITSRAWGMSPVSTPTVTACTANSRPCVDIQMSYTVNMNFVFFRSFSWSNLTLTENRRVFVQ